MSLEVTNISLALGGKQIISDVSFTVADGQFVSLLGQSGAGKSTILKTIAGILLQDSGEIRINGACVDDMPTHKRQTAIVFQDIRLFPNMTLEENVAFPLKMKGMPKAQRLERARELLGLVQLEGLGGRRVGQVSGGQQQRAALARALASEPRVLLLDEPFSGLDENLRDEMRALVVELHKKLRTTTVLVTHDAYEALMVSDEIVYLDGGRVVQEAEPRELYARPKSAAIAACFGDCETVEGAVEGGVFRAGMLELPAGEARCDCPEQPAQAVVRHGAVSLGAGGACAGRVSACAYRGDSWLVSVEIGEGKVVTGRASEPYDVGAMASFDVSERDVFVFV